MPEAHDHNHLIEDWRNPKGGRGWAAILAISALIVLVGGVVYGTGGTAYVWLHGMYLPIILAAAVYRVPGGMAAALAGGLVLGPFMPLLVSQELPQQTPNWLLRTGFFLLVGGVTGTLFTWLNRQYERLKTAHEELVASHLELQQTQMELIQAEKLESVGRLAAGVAHEVKNPLAILQLGLDFLATVIRDNAAVTETIGEMDAAVKRADAVIKGLVDYSRFDKLDLKPQQLNPVVEAALVLVRHELAKERIRVEARLCDTIPPVALDRGKIEQVLVNLFMNAVHAMEGGGELTVTTCERVLAGDDLAGFYPSQQRFAVGDLAVVAEVADTGSGIPEDTLDKLFDPFFTTKPVGKGTGLGLSVCRKIIDLHDAAIGIGNRREGGVKVTILLKPGERRVAL